jgi:hypothetical protein
MKKALAEKRRDDETKTENDEEFPFEKPDPDTDQNHQSGLKFDLPADFPEQTRNFLEKHLPSFCLVVVTSCLP